MVNFIAEYTIDDQSSASLPTRDDGSHVETSASSSSSLSNRNKLVSALIQCKVSLPKIDAASYVETSTQPSSNPAVPSTGLVDLPVVSPVNDQGTVHPNINVETPAHVKCESVTCPEDGLILSSYPWKKKLQVKITRLSDFDINLWCGTNNNKNDNVPLPVEMDCVIDPASLKTEEMEVKPLVVANVKGYGLHSVFNHKHSHSDSSKPTKPAHSDQSTEKLLAHANALINQVSIALNAVNVVYH